MLPRNNFYVLAVLICLIFTSFSFAQTQSQTQSQNQTQSQSQTQSQKQNQNQNQNQNQDQDLVRDKARDKNILIQFYQDHLSAADGHRCPMSPSCSEYAARAIKKHGLFVGWIMACDRLVRCGRDEVTISPLRFVNGKSYTFDPVDANDFWWFDQSNNKTNNNADNKANNKTNNNANNKAKKQSEKDIPPLK